MTHVTLKGLLSQVTHATCGTCEMSTKIEDLGLDMNDFDTDDDFINIVEMGCCDDEFPIPVIVSDGPLFPPDDVTTPANDEAMFPTVPPMWEYEVKEDLVKQIND